MNLRLVIMTIMVHIVTEAAMLVRKGKSRVVVEVHSVRANLSFSFL